MATGNTRGGDGGSGSTRAVDAALSATRSFVPRGAVVADRTSHRIGQKWAPEGAGAGRDRSLSALSFVDRLLTPYVDAPETAGVPGGMPASDNRAPRRRRFTSQPPSSWLFPVPWYQDELAWLEAARQAAMLGEDRAPSAAPRTEAARAMAVPIRDLPLIAPSLAGMPARRGRASVAPTGAPRRVAIVAADAPSLGAAATALRAWTPSVSLAAAQAAEIMAGAVASEPARGEPGRAMSAPVMELLAPMEVESLAGAAAQAPRAPGAAPQVGRPLAARVDAVRRALAASPAAAAPASPAAAASALPAAAPPVVARPVADRASSAPAATGAGAPPAAPLPAPARVSELLARAVVSGGRQLAPAAGPRVALPAGLGGLIAGAQAARAVARPPVERRRVIGRMPASAAAIAPAAAPRTPTALRPVSSLAPQPIYAASALSSIEAERPAAIGHVAWADRWLARFGGASSGSLTALEGASSDRQQRATALAPAPVFLQMPAAARPEPIADTELPLAPPTAGAAAGRTPARAHRMGDDEVTPDSVFEALARAAAEPPPRRSPARPGARSAAPATPTAPPATPTAPPAPTPWRGSRPASMADRLLALPPAAQGPGMRAQLAASPVAPALSGWVDLPVSPAFDVRATAPAGIARAYLGGSILPLAVTEGPSSRPRIIRPFEVLAGRRGDAATHPAILRALASRAPQIAMLTSAADPRVAFADQRAPWADGLAPKTLAPETLAPKATIARSADAAPAMPVSAPGTLVPDPESVAPEALAAPLAATDEPVAMAPAPMVEAMPPAMPAFTVDLTADRGLAGPRAAAALSRRELQSTWTAEPGRTAQLAQAWSVEQSEASADLAYDFVAPELVLAAQLYGFSPVEAAQAARIAGGGRARLTQMAAAVDYAFVAALAGDVALDDSRAAAVGVAAGAGRATPASVSPPAPTAAAPTSAESYAAPPTVGRVFAEDALAAWSADSAQVPAARPGQTPRGRAPRRWPRGAFLWPESIARALGIAPGAGDGDGGSEHVLARAALDLLAAHVVVEAGIDAAPVTDGGDAPAVWSSAASTAASPAGLTPELSAVTRPFDAGVDPVESLEPIAVPSPPSGHRGPLPPAYEAVYLALSRSPEGRALSPSVRAARALALTRAAAPSTAGASASARHRAAAAWAVMPMVYTGADELAGELSPVGTDAPAPAASPALAAARRQAGQSLQSLVAPVAPEPASGGSAATAASAMFAESAARPGPPRDLVTRPAPAPKPAPAPTPAKVAAESNELPSWFESAARKLLSEQAGDSEGLTLAEMTLVTAAPVRYVAASGLSAGGAPAAQGPAVEQQPGAGEAKDGQGGADVEELAQKVYAEVCRLIDLAKERNGDPWA